MSSSSSSTLLLRHGKAMAVELGLCFGSDRDEQEYKMGLQPALADALLKAACCVVLLWLFIIPASLVYHSNKEEAGFAWAGDDTRTVAYSYAFVVLGCNILAALLFWMFQTWATDWEWTAVFFSIFNVCSPFFMTAWYSAGLFGSTDSEDKLTREEQQEELLAVIWVLALLSGLCTFLPVRALVFWLVPVFTSICYPILIICVGTNRPFLSVVIVACSLVICANCCLSSIREERLHRRDWAKARASKPMPGTLSGPGGQEFQTQGSSTCSSITSQKDSYLGTKRSRSRDNRDREAASTSEDPVVTKAIAQVIEAAVEMRSFCEVLVTLSASGTVLNATAAHKVYFGRNMEGVGLSDAFMPEQRVLLARLLLQVSTCRELRSTCAALDLPGGETQVQIVALDTCSEPVAYVVGIFGGEPDVWLGQLQVGALEHRHREQQLQLQRQRQARSQSWWQPRPAEQEGFGTFADVFDHFQQVGLDEGWFLAPEQVDLLREHPLGAGDFAVVMASRVHHSRQGVLATAATLPRAASVPHWSVQLLAPVFQHLRQLQRVHHPNIAHFAGACFDPDTGVVATFHELIHGVRLDVFITTWSPQAWQVVVRTQLLKLLLEIAAGIQHLHNLSPALGHGSVEPSNILVEPLLQAPRAKLLLPSMAEHLPGREVHFARGPGKWCAPERLSEMLTALQDPGSLPPLSKLEPPSDVFSFGLVFHFVLVGVRPRWREGDRGDFQQASGETEEASQRTASKASKKSMGSSFASFTKPAKAAIGAGVGTLLWPDSSNNNNNNNQNNSATSATPSPRGATVVHGTSDGHETTSASAASASASAPSQATAPWPRPRPSPSPSPGRPESPSPSKASIEGRALDIVDIDVALEALHAPSSSRREQEEVEEQELAVVLSKEQHVLLPAERAICKACLKIAPGQRPIMAEVQEALLSCFPKDRHFLSGLPSALIATSAATNPDAGVGDRGVYDQNLELGTNASLAYDSATTLMEANRKLNPSMFGVVVQGANRLAL